MIRRSKRGFVSLGQRPTPLRSLRPRDLWKVIPLLAVVLGACWLLYGHQVEAARTSVAQRQVARVEVLVHLLRGQLRPVCNDLRMLADGNGLQEYLATGSEQALQKARARAAFFSRLYPEYVKVRYIDTDGREVIRVNEGGEIVPRPELQDKALRPFVQRSLLLQPDQVFVSAFDLNYEHGHIELPYRPMLRFAVPVFDAKGTRRGLFIINFDGTRLIDSLASGDTEAMGQLRVLNAQGFWIRAGDPGEEWGAQIPERVQWNLATQAPDVWDAVTDDAAGQARFDGGLFTWRRVDPAEFAGGDSSLIVAEEPFIVIGTEVPASAWSKPAGEIRDAFRIVVPTLCLLVLVAFWFIVARSRAREALQASEESLAVTLHSIGEGVIATDTRGRISRMNAVAEELTGCRRGEALGQPVDSVLRLVGEETRQPLESLVAQVLGSGRGEGHHRRSLLVRRDGHEVPVSDDAAPIRDGRGNVKGVVLVFRDVSRDREAERALRESAERIRDLYNNAPCGYHSLDANGVFVEINDTELRWIGHSREEVVGHLMFTDLLTDDSRAVFRSNFPRFKEEGFIRDLEFEMVRANGQRMTVLVSATAITDAEGNYVSSRTTVFDISDRRRLQTERDRFFNLPLDMICIADAEGVFRRVNPAVKAILGWEPAELVGQQGLKWVHPDDVEQTVVARNQLALGEPLQQFENRYRHKDGSWRVISWHTYLASDGLRYATGRDVTEEKRIMEQVRELNRTLSQRSGELEAANKELESFSYSVSHDLRAPLRHIQGYVGLLERAMKDQLDEKPARYLRTIAAAAAEMGQLIDDLLAFSRMGRKELQETVVDLAEVVEEQRARLMAANPRRTIDWTIAPLPRVMGDEAMLRQVFANLLDNAVKYTGKREDARIEVTATEPDDGWVTISVRDNGAGFDMQYANKLFGVFQRLHRQEDFEGTGIGLATVRRIIVRHGGRTWGEGELDKGASFYFTIRCAR